METRLEKLKKYFPLSAKSWLAFIVVMSIASAISFLLMQTTNSDVHVPLIFVLAVLVVALTTDGYLYGLLAAVASVFGVNWAFTYPYFKLDFSIYGYPLTFITMLAVGMAVSTLASRIKAQEQMRIEAEKEKMRATLLRSISHDLRTPLTTISGTISTILEEDGKLSREQERNLLSDARQNAEWLYRMVENILSITRMNNTTGEITTQPEVPEEVLSEVISRFSASHPGAKIETFLPEEFFFVPMDAILIEQVFLNLMDNAVTHGHAGRISIRLTKDNSFARFTVADNGTGIDRRRLHRLFDDSLQLSGLSGGDNDRFMGIGLAVCKTIVNAHGGEISAANQDGGGAVFTFTLKL